MIQSAPSALGQAMQRKRPREEKLEPPTSAKRLQLAFERLDEHDKKTNRNKTDAWLRVLEDKPRHALVPRTFTNRLAGPVLRQWHTLGHYKGIGTIIQQFADWHWSHRITAAAIRMLPDATSQQRTWIMQLAASFHEGRPVGLQDVATLDPWLRLTAQLAWAWTESKSFADLRFCLFTADPSLVQNFLYRAVNAPIQDCIAFHPEMYHFLNDSQLEVSSERKGAMGREFRADTILLWDNWRAHERKFAAVYLAQRERVHVFGLSSCL